MVKKKRERNKLGNLALRAGLVTPDQVERALELQKKCDKLLGEILIDMGICTQDDIDYLLSMQARFLNGGVCAKELLTEATEAQSNTHQALDDVHDMAAQLTEK